MAAGSDTNLGLAGYVTGGDMTGIDNNSCTKPHYGAQRTASCGCDSVGSRG
jgi:hypothetical protein